MYRSHRCSKVHYNTTYSLATRTTLQSTYLLLACCAAMLYLYVYHTALLCILKEKRVFHHNHIDLYLIM